MKDRLKELSELAGAKRQELQALHQKITVKEKRAYSADEAKQFDLLEAEANNLAEEAQREFRARAVASDKPIELSRDEARAVDRFDLGRALRASAGLNGCTLDGVEKELVEEGAREFRGAAPGMGFQGIMLPRLMCRRHRIEDHGREQRAGMSATGTTSTTGDQGGQLVQTSVVGLLDPFYNRDVLANLGITTYDGLTGNLNLPRGVRPTAPTHKDETGGADALSHSLATLALTPCRLPAYEDVTEQLLLQSNPVLRTWLDANVLSEIRSLMQISLLHGTGSGNAPTGVAATTGIGAVYAGGASSNGTNADGATPVYDDAINLESAVANANADEGNLAYLFNSKLRGKLKKTLRASSTDSFMIWDDRAGGLINGYRPVVTNAVSSTLTKGASSGILSGAFFANWKDLVRAIWGGLNLQVVTDGTLATTGKVRIVASIFYNGGAQRPASFAYGADFKTT